MKNLRKHETSEASLNAGRERAVEGLLRTDFGESVDVDLIVAGCRDRLAGVSRRERQTVSAPPAAAVRSWRWGITAAAAGLLIALGGLLIGQWGRLTPGPRASVAVLVEAEGSVFRLLGGRREALATGARLAAGDVIAGGTGQSRALVRFTHGVELSLLSATTATIRDSGAFVRSGRATFSVTPRPQPVSDPVLVATPHAEITVVGTLFTVSVAEQHSRVELLRGKLRVRNLRSAEVVALEANHAALVGPRTIVEPLAVAAWSAPARPARVRSGLLAFYTFHEGDGSVVHDVSGVGRPLDLHIDRMPAVRWLSGGGLSISRSAMLLSGSPADKITDACWRSNELTVEAWIVPANAGQGMKPRESRIVSVSGGSLARDFSLLQIADIYAMRRRTTATDGNGQPALMTGHGTAGPRLTHVVYARGADGIERFLVDGREVGTALGVPHGAGEASRPSVAGDFAAWASYHLLLGNELHSGRAWLGTYHLVAIYERALTAEEVARNYRAGPPGRGQVPAEATGPARSL